MKKIIQLCAPIGFLIFVAYKTINHFIPIPDSIGNLMRIIGVICMLIGIIYNGWCIGKHKNPYK